MPISAYVNKSSFIDGFRAMACTNPPKIRPTPTVLVPTPVMANPAAITPVPASRFIIGMVRGIVALNGASEAVGFNAAAGRSLAMRAVRNTCIFDWCEDTGQWRGRRQELDQIQLTVL